jgi:hypothetical protein
MEWLHCSILRVSASAVADAASVIAFDKAVSEVAGWLSMAVPDSDGDSMKIAKTITLMLQVKKWTLSTILAAATMLLVRRCPWNGWHGRRLSDAAVTVLLMGKGVLTKQVHHYENNGLMQMNLTVYRGDLTTQFNFVANRKLSRGDWSC